MKRRSSRPNNGTSNRPSRWSKNTISRRNTCSRNSSHGRSRKRSKGKSVATWPTLIRFARKGWAKQFGAGSAGGGKLSGLPNPPKDFGNDPPAIDGYRSGLILSIFRDQNLGVIKALQAGYDKAVIFVSRHHNLPIKLGPIGLRSVDHDDVAVVNEWHHGTAMNTETTGIGRVGTPLAGRSQHGLGRNLIEAFDRIALPSVGGCYNRQKRNRYQVIRSLGRAMGSSLDDLQP